jgi:predicted nucleotidyltransferase component of viral defense system
MTSFQTREFFYLVFLRLLAGRLAGRQYAVKGGICLRFFHRSQRLSEDMDFDIAQIPVKTLANHVNTILSGRPLLAFLSNSGVIQIRFTSPKQTETTQRWKVQLVSAFGASLQARLEFSHRREKVLFSQGIPSAERLQEYVLPPFVTQYYDQEQMTLQKLEALAAPRRHAVRDLFDFHHLLSVAPTQNAHEPLKQTIPSLLEIASEKITSFDYSQFQSEVLPFLSEELVSFYQKKENFHQMQDQVLKILHRNLP